MTREQKAIALAALALSGCGLAVEPAAPPVTWRFEPACAPPTEDEWVQIDRALGLWAEWGIELIEDDLADDEVRVCLMFGEPTRGFDGWISGDLIEVNRRNTSRIVTILAHEFGHRILDSDYIDDHLPDGQRGIMGWRGEGDAWSDDDARHLERFSLARVP